MAITYEWKIVELERYTDTGGVFIVHYACVGTDDITGTSSRNIGVISLNPDPSTSDFIPFENLTEEVVLPWVKEHDGLGEKIETAIANKINALDNPTTLSGLPW